jgi:hypothetical protein
MCQIDVYFTEGRVKRVRGKDMKDICTHVRSPIDAGLDGNLVRPCETRIQKLNGSTW